jgi:biopolymer transport protein ExbD
MSIFDKKRSIDDKIPTSSMADIAFLLLVFFLVTTVFPKDKGLAVVLPEIDRETPVPAKNVLHLLVSTSGTVEVRRGESQHVQTVRAEDVADTWRVAVAENPLLIAAVKTHPDAEYRHMIGVLDALHLAGARRVSIQALGG